MKHILLQFAEIPEREDIHLSVVEYDHELNLNVIRGSKTPAITFTDQATETFTKVQGEGADSDRDIKYNISSLLETSTQTRVSNEGSDSDPMYHIGSMLDTSTHTLVHAEVSDSDKNFRDIEFLSATRTLTESSEALDSDK